MRLVLIPHPSAPAPPGLTLAVSAAWQDENLVLSYDLQGLIADIVWPAPAEPRFTDELWRATCFEAFFSMAPQSPYRELNAAPSGLWATYDFAGYRTGMRRAVIQAPTITAQMHARRAAVSVIIPGEALIGFATWTPTAVIATIDGAISYWAPAHAADKPDFHTLAGMAPLPQQEERA
jgi:hypothetical protein